jgi:hypothetical protein
LLLFTRETSEAAAASYLAGALKAFTESAKCFVRLIEEAFDLGQNCLDL